MHYLMNVRGQLDCTYNIASSNNEIGTYHFSPALKSYVNSPSLFFTEQAAVAIKPELLLGGLVNPADLGR
jgi:hypothetical protein